MGDASQGAHAEPAFRIVGTDADGGLKLTAGEPHFRHGFRVVAMTDTVEGKVELSVAPFQDESGREIRETGWRWVGAGGAVSISTSRAFEVTAPLPRPGVYATEIDLVYAGKRTTTRLLVTRPAPAAPGVEVLGGHEARAVKWLSGGHVDLDLVLRETEGQALTIHSPALSFLDLRGVGSDHFQTRGRRLVPWGGSLSLGPSEQGTLRVTLGDLDEPGRYEGSLRLDVAGRKPLDVPFAVTVKESMWIAALLIAAGVVGSHLVRLYFGEVRQRLVHRRNILRVARDLDARAAGDADERERAVLRALRGRLDELREDLALGVETDFDAAVEVVAEKLPLLDAWRDLRARAARLDPEAARGLLSKLDGVAAVLVRPGATKEQVASAAASLEALDVRTAERDAVTRALQALEKEAARDPKIAAQIAPLAREAWQLLNRDRIDEARAVTEKARLLHARQLAASLRRCLDGPKARGFDDASWSALREAEKPHLDAVDGAEDADGAAAAYAEAARTYLDATARALASDATAMAEAIQQREDLDRAALGARLDRARSKIDEAVARIAGASWGDASAMEADAERELAAIERSMYPAQPFLAEDTFAAWAPGTVPALAIAAQRASEAAAPPTPEAVGARIRSYDGAVTAFILLVAVATGIKLLWAGNETWGGVESWLVAFLWGLGLHQVGSAPFEGLVGLREKLSKPG